MWKASLSRHLAHVRASVSRVSLLKVTVLSKWKLNVLAVNKHLSYLLFYSNSLLTFSLSSITRVSVKSLYAYFESVVCVLLLRS